MASCSVVADEALATAFRWLLCDREARMRVGDTPAAVRDQDFSAVGEIARCRRHTRDPLDLPAAAMLHRALTCSREDRARDALSNAAEHAAAGRLIAARLLEDDRGVLRPTRLAEATFRGSPERRYLRWTA